jgi:hypothetical protein
MCVQMVVPNYLSSGKHSPQRPKPCAQPQRKNSEPVFLVVEPVRRPSASSRKKRFPLPSQYACVAPARCQKAPLPAKSTCTVITTGTLVEPNCAVVRDREIVPQIGPPRQRSLTQRFLHIHSILCRPRRPRSSLVLWDVCLANCGIDCMTLIHFCCFLMVWNHTTFPLESFLAAICSVHSVSNDPHIHDAWSNPITFT